MNFLRAFYEANKSVLHGVAVAAIGGAGGAIMAFLDSSTAVNTCTANIPACLVALKGHAIAGAVGAVVLYFRTPPQKPYDGQDRRGDANAAK